MQSPLRICFPFLFLALSSAAGNAQSSPPLSLREAVHLCLDKNPERQIAKADVQSAKVSSKLARTALLPNLFFGQNATRGNDPVYVFGTRLRQQRFQQSDFALNSLNRPAPINNIASSVSGNWMAFDSWHTEFEIRRSDLLAKAASATAIRSDEEIVRRVVEAFESVLLAIRQADLADHEVQTAEAMQVSSETRVAAGVAVDSDKLTASANLAERQKERIAAHGRVEIAWAELEAAIGDTIPTEQRKLTPLTEKHFDPLPFAEAAAAAKRSRSDRHSLSLEMDAQRAAVKSAKSAFGPEISAFGKWETDRQSIGAAGGNNWIAGAELRLDLLPAGKREALAATQIGLRRAQAVSDSADQKIKLEVTRAYYEHEAAAKMLDVARASTDQTEESLRILRDRYEAGLATFTDVLRAEDAERQSRTNYWYAVYQNTMTYANLRFAIGALTADAVEDLQ